MILGNDVVCIKVRTSEIGLIVQGRLLTDSERWEVGTTTLLGRISPSSSLVEELPIYVRGKSKKEWIGRGVKWFKVIFFFLLQSRKFQNTGPVQSCRINELCILCYCLGIPKLFSRNCSIASIIVHS